MTNLEVDTQLSITPAPVPAPLLHLLLHVDALLLQQLSLGESPVHGLSGGLGTRGSLPLLPSLLRVVEAEDVALPHDYAISYRDGKSVDLMWDDLQGPCGMEGGRLEQRWCAGSRDPPERRMLGSVTFLPFT